MWAARPLFLAFGGTSPKPPGRGRSPLHPRFNQGRRRPTFFKEADFSRRESGGHPHSPRQGATPPGPPVFPPSWAGGLPAFWGVNLSPGPSPRRRGENPAKFSPFPLREGGQGVRSGAHPPNPLPWGLRPPGPPLAHPRRLRVRQSFGSHSWRVC